VTSVCSIYIDKWAEKYDSNEATIFEFMMDYLDEFKEQYELI
jgi:hypothetical protein